MTFTMAEMDVVTGNSSIGTISDAQVVSLDITDADFFAGTGAALNGSRDDIVTDGDTIGFLVEDGGLTINSVKSDTDSYTGVEASIVSAQLLGIPAIDLQIGGDLRFNNTSGDHKINWTTATDPANNSDSLLADLDISESISLQVLNGHGSLDIGRVM